MEHHKSGSLSQKNKPFKRRTGSKRQQKIKGKKKTEAVSCRPILADPKEVRRNQQKQRQMASRQKQLERNRKEKMGIGAPRLVGFMSLGGGNVQQTVQTLSQHWTVASVRGDITYVKTEFNKRLALWFTQQDIWNRMDVGKIADIMVFVIGGETTPEEEEKLDFLVAQGLGDIVLLGEKGKLKKGRWSGMRVYDAEKEGGLIVRNLCDMAVKTKIEGPGYFVIDSAEKKEDGVVINGYVRRSQLSRLYSGYIVGIGDVSVKAIGTDIDPYGVGNKTEHSFEIEQEEVDEEEKEEESNEMSEEEVSEPQNNTTTVVHITKKVPVGAGSYTGAWIVGDEGEELEEQVVEEIEEDDMNVDDVLDMEEENEEHVNETDEERTNRLFNEYMEFPDRYRVKRGESAKETFKGYRGLRSLRQSEWDCDEELPKEYNDLVQFDNYKRMCECFKDVEDGVEEGTYVSVYISTPQYAGSLVNKVFCSLRQYENEQSIIHVLFTIEPDSLPLKSNTTFTIQIGDRRYQRNIVFTENGMMGNKYKIIRWAAPGSCVIGSFYGYITYPPAPAMLFMNVDGNEELVATGTVDNVDPSRILIERVLLTGTPIKIGKRKATIRGLFTQPSDAKWFKPIELFTKQGVCGNILCSLGEKGLVKCTFEQQLKSNDVVTLALYRRVFPLPPLVSAN
ncbi:hypothetical protein EHI8A_034070 [Entamoeba histolytica HM-1:IMSS-B]|uniref:Ribosome biogenesis protein BMS1/TSR1 C-terminal domain-containing protein n=6 Tax=Entamoeba histolytica TaxID=5759 RepID=C4M0L5_ENTH1|nr:hypothetical protein, conserved [Entamoeba histolytica HM-1:IMSS]EMD43766.1 ribosome biogenesis protein tsr1, putative [Entamoeba histolytica KU27]EMH72210.1 hypothetical protein EHI8A_034070 [Entamoeba histolytica HM-1:IMSS-B]EMS17456.1 ribosome biogenesis protein tsr1, putative [Entamoeba histolytica HM-3:IMSS]ENY63700.1 ribosome biogenesis protein tsr1, putative [Entamoeba histolytica HM-1:IMSS-A]GAT94709.1 hypothetical protein conserved [Entamoeba histolytica]|eukprot:XP_652560.1 hypothetical protein, conserved [Entamoeba histolytica HM-1:IMSS]